jgi:hypothetical protein
VSKRINKKGFKLILDNVARTRDVKKAVKGCETISFSRSARF